MVMYDVVFRLVLYAGAKIPGDVEGCDNPPGQKDSPREDFAGHKEGFFVV